MLMIAVPVVGRYRFFSADRGHHLLLKPVHLQADFPSTVSGEGFAVLLLYSTTFLLVRKHCFLQIQDICFYNQAPRIRMQFFLYLLSGAPFAQSCRLLQTKTGSSEVTANDLRAHGQTVCPHCFICPVFSVLFICCCICFFVYVFTVLSEHVHLHKRLF